MSELNLGRKYRTKSKILDFVVCPSINSHLQ